MLKAQRCPVEPLSFSGLVRSHKKKQGRTLLMQDLAGIDLFYNKVYYYLRESE